MNNASLIREAELQRLEACLAHDKALPTAGQAAEDESLQELNSQDNIETQS